MRPAVDASEDPRFEMLGVIREYGAERLAQRDDAASTGRRHAEWALAFIEAEAPALEAGVDLARLDWLAREHDNLRSALAWSVRNDEREIGLRLATAAWRFWQQRGHVVEGREWFDRLLPPDQEPGSLDSGTLPRPTPPPEGSRTGRTPSSRPVPTIERPSISTGVSIGAIDCATTSITSHLSR